MRFNRIALKAAAEAAIEAHRVAFADDREAEQATFEEKRAAWVAEHSDAWRAACKAITAKLRKGQPIQNDDLPKKEGWHSTIELWSEQQPRQREYRQPRELVELVAALDVIADDEVTTTGLHAVGMTRTAVTAAVRHLAAGQVRS